MDKFSIKKHTVESTGFSYYDVCKGDRFSPPSGFKVERLPGGLCLVNIKNKEAYPIEKDVDGFFIRSNNDHHKKIRIY